MSNTKNITTTTTTGVKPTPVVTKTPLKKGEDVVKHEKLEKGLLTKYIELPKVISSDTKETVAASTTTDSSGLDLTAMLSRQLADYKTAPVSIEDYVKPVTFVTAASGIYRVVKTEVALFTTLYKKYDTPITALPDMEQGVHLLIPKIPFKHIIKALTFFRDVFAQDKTESSLLFFWNTHDKELPNIPGVFAEGKLVAYCPVQENTGTLTSFGDDPELQWFRDELGLLLELHSHCDFAAFYSGTDNANENMNQFYGVWGYVPKEEPMFVFRWVSGDVKQECSPEILIDWPKVRVVEEKETINNVKVSVVGDNDLIDLDLTTLEEKEVVVKHEPLVHEELIKGPYKRVDYPEEWLTKQHSKYSYSYKGSTYKYGNYGYGGYGYGSYDYGYGGYGSKQITPTTPTTSTKTNYNQAPYEIEDDWSYGEIWDTTYPDYYPSTKKTQTKNKSAEDYLDDDINFSKVEKNKRTSWRSRRTLR